VAKKVFRTISDVGLRISVITIGTHFNRVGFWHLEFVAQEFGQTGTWSGRPGLNVSVWVYGGRAQGIPRRAPAAGRR